MHRINIYRSEHIPAHRVRPAPEASCGTFFLAANTLPLVSFRRLPCFRLRVCNHGVACLKIFLLSTACSIADSVQELAERIKQIIAETGCEKVKIIAHSKGDLDCRYAIKHCGVVDCVASLTTINTPHRGCLFADYLLEKVSPAAKEFLLSFDQVL